MFSEDIPDKSHAVRCNRRGSLCNWGRRWLGMNWKSYTSGSGMRGWTLSCRRSGCHGRCVARLLISPSCLEKFWSFPKFGNNWSWRECIDQSWVVLRYGEASTAQVLSSISSALKAENRLFKVPSGRRHSIGLGLLSRDNASAVTLRAPHRCVGIKVIANWKLHMCLHAFGTSRQGIVSCRVYWSEYISLT